MLSCVLSFQCSVLLVLPVIAHQHLIFLLLSLTLLAINPRLRYYRTYSTHYVHSDIDCQFFSTIISSQGLLAAPGPVPMSSSAPHAATVHIPQPRRHLEYSTGHRHSPSLEKKPTSKSSSQDDQDQSSIVKPKPKRSLRLPIVRDQYTDDEEEDEELSKLSANHLSAGLSDGPLGREQPFTPMVNREMLCSLVRYSFQQTEEQQLQFEQILRHEYGRKSKGWDGSSGMMRAS